MCILNTLYNKLLHLAYNDIYLLLIFMEGTKHTLIINYKGMRIGGIETYFSKLMSFSINQGYRVIWITTDYFIKQSQFKNVTDDSRIEKVIDYSKHWIKANKIVFSQNERITMVSCEPIQYIKGEDFIRKMDINRAGSSFFKY